MRQSAAPQTLIFAQPAMPFPGAAEAEVLARALERAGLRLWRASTLEEVLSLLQPGPGSGSAVSAVVTDAELADTDALTLLAAVSQRSPRTPVLVHTGEVSAAFRMRLFEEGAEDLWRRALPVEEQVARVLRTLRRKTELDKLHAEATALRHLATTDGLTQLSNYRHFQERLADEYRRASRYGDALSLLLLDLDHFKQVNDRHGHLLGDQALRHVARVIQRNVRDTDLVARQGGEEFAVILPKTTLEGARTVAERIVQDIRETPVEAPGVRGVRLTTSLGLASYPLPPFESAEQLLNAADSALYEAKRTGRDRACLFDPQHPPALPVHEPLAALGTA